MKRTRKVSIRVHPTVVEGLKLVAEIADANDLTLSDFVRSCVNFGLTRNLKHLPKYLRDDSYGEFPTLDDVTGWQDALEYVSQP